MGFQNVAGLDNGAGVRVGGIHLGTVKYISLPSGPNGKLTVVMDMADSTKNIVRQDSVATIKTEGLLGDNMWRSLSDRRRREPSRVATQSRAKHRSISPMPLSPS